MDSANFIKEIPSSAIKQKNPFNYISKFIAVISDISVILSSFYKEIPTFNLT